VISHFACRWDHDLLDEPIRVYEEIDERRMEVRKVEEYRDGRLVRADTVNDTRTSLSWEPLPGVAEIESQAEFSVEPLTAEQFDAVWTKATDAT